jgi:hypothetical protein
MQKKISRGLLQNAKEISKGLLQNAKENSKGKRKFTQFH